MKEVSHWFITRHTVSWLPGWSLLFCNDWVISVCRCDRKPEQRFFTHWVPLKTSLVCSWKNFAQWKCRSLLLIKSDLLFASWPSWSVWCCCFYTAHRNASYAFLCLCSISLLWLTLKHLLNLFALIHHMLGITVLPLKYHFYLCWLIACSFCNLGNNRIFSLDRT